MSPLLSDAFALAERAGGAPVHLYTFARGSVMWRYTSDGLACSVAATGLTYTAAKIHHDEIQRKDESGAVDIKLTLGARLAVVDALRDGSSEPMVCAIHRYHPSAGGAPARFAYGTVGSLSVDSTNKLAELTLATSESQFDLDVPKTLITVQCAKSTYSAECGVKWEDFAQDVQIVDVAHRTVTVDSVGSAPDGYYDFGVAKIGRELVYIERQVGTALTVFNEVPLSFTVGATVTLLAGDDKNPSTCRAKFDNLARFLGFPWLPAKNPLLVRDGAPSPARTTWDEPYGDPGSYVTPAPFGWWHGDSIVFDVAGNVEAWADVSGNGRDWTQDAAILRPAGNPPDGIPPADGHDTGLIMFGQRWGPGSGADPSMPYIGSPALTWLGGVDLSALAATGAEIFVNLRVANDVNARADTGSDKFRGLWWMNGPGYGSCSDVFPMADGTIRSTWGLPFNYRYILPPPRANLTQECVYNISNSPDRWTARLNGNVLYTVASSYDGHSPSFQSGSQIGFAPGGQLLGTGDIDRWFYGIFRRMLIYPGTLSPADRAAALTYTQTGVGSPPGMP